MKKTKIVCTIGPKTESKEMLAKLLNAGMNVMRLNFSHGDYEEHGNRIKNVRAVCAETGMKCAILLDTKGPEIRTIKLEGGNDVDLVAGQTFTFTTDKSVVGNKDRVAVTYPGLAPDLKPGNIVLVDDGLIGLEVTSVTATEVICKVLNNGALGENKGVNLPNVKTSLPALAEADDGFRYVVKFSGSGHGTKMLISELIGGAVAKILGLRIPELVYVQLDEAFGRSEGDEEIQDLLQGSQGLNLALQLQL